MLPCGQQPDLSPADRSLADLKRLGCPFIQRLPCLRYPTALRCIDCHRHAGRPSTVCCRFQRFRKLRYADGHLQAIGFCDTRDIRPTDGDAWRVHANRQPPLTVADARQIVRHCAGALERLAGLSGRPDGPVLWKRWLAGVRELCDGCSTTLFDGQRVCALCGWSLCPFCWPDARKRTACVHGGIHGPEMRVCRVLPGDVLPLLVRQTRAVALPPFELDVRPLEQSGWTRKAGLWRHSGGAGLAAAFRRCWPVEPLLVGGVRLRFARWRPEAMREACARMRCRVKDGAGRLHENVPMEAFWTAFGGGRAIAEGRLRLTDWPTGSDFGTLLPEWATDVGEALRPMFGALGVDLVGRLPAEYVRPDMGPKLYAAYGDEAGDEGDETGDEDGDRMGTTNLHLDMSDAVNVLAYVAGAEGAVGAVWHVFAASDADRLRVWLRGRTERWDDGDDPIHDQCWYLTGEMRRELAAETGVRPWRVTQRLGEAIWVPAGCAHQVRNVRHCVKVALDFVSPASVERCFALMAEFRLLSAGHANREDKLQLPSMVVHAMRDALQTLGEAPGATDAKAPRAAGKARRKAPERDEPDAKRR